MKKKLKQIDAEWMKKNSCPNGYKWFVAEYGNKKVDFDKVVRAAIKAGNLRGANSGITKLMNKKQCVQYAVYAAKQVIKIYGKRYPNDNRPRKAINAAEKYLKNPCKRTRDTAAAAAYTATYAATYAAANAANAAAYTAAYAANAAAYTAADAAAYTATYVVAYAAANAAAAAANAAAYAAYTAAYAAADVANATADAAYAAYAAADAAAYTAADEKTKMKIKIIKHGIKLLKQ